LKPINQPDRDAHGPTEPCIRWGRDPSTGRAILGVVRAIEKALEVSVVVYAAKGIIPSLIMAFSERDRSVLNNGTTNNVAFNQNSLTICCWLSSVITFFEVTHTVFTGMHTCTILTVSTAILRSTWVKWFPSLFSSVTYSKAVQSFGTNHNFSI